MPDQTFVSCAQNGEDVVLRRAFRGLDNGTYIDVGANHPSQDSISRSFYDAGWRGLTVEPVPALAKMHREQRPEDELFQGVIVADGSAPVVLHSYDDHGLSTIVDSVRDTHEQGGRRATDLTVQGSRLDALLEERGWQDRPIHFMTVDTEGAELDVVRSIDLTRWRPWVLVIEATLPNSDTPSHAAWEPLVLEAGYEFCLFDGLSRFYVAQEHADELRRALSYPACVLDGYVTWHLAAARQQIDHIEEQRRLTANDAQVWRTAATTRWAESIDAALYDPAELDRLEKLVSELSASVDQARTELAATHGTLSWRVTRPLRMARRLRPGA